MAQGGTNIIIHNLGNSEAATYEAFINLLVKATAGTVTLTVGADVDTFTLDGANGEFVSFASDRYPYFNSLTVTCDASGTAQIIETK